MRQRASSIFGSSASTQADAGFSLVELMVAITVMTFITGVVVVQFSGFDSAIVTKARAYDAAQAVRSAQAFATQVRATTTVDTTFTTRYLTRFTKGSGEILVMRKEGTNDPQTIEYRQLTAGYKVQELRVVYALGTTVRCATTNGQFLDISFQRPEVTASSTPSMDWVTISSPVIRSYVGIVGADTSLIHWVEVDAPGSVSIAQSAPDCP